ncbi:hypothetical protein HY494_02415 [Candidatus Woesearchaeota archaeon]|nr:hypothetical protein [Candidatus Woesearchaeota archaeon]
MKLSFKKLLLNWRVLLLLTFLILSFLTIHPQLFGHEGAVIRRVAPNSAAFLAGLQNPSSAVAPVDKERLLSLNGEAISSASDYYVKEAALYPNTTVRLETSKGSFALLVPAGNKTVDLGLRVYDVPTSNLRKGLDLEGGTRVLLKPAEKISPDELDVTVDSLRERLNVYGLSDIVVRSASDLAGDNFILIEIAGVTEDEIQELLSKQGKFEAKIGNETVFSGGKKDITYVCRSADCSGIDPRVGCQRYDNGYNCRFAFQISLSPEAAQHHAQITRQMGTLSESGSCYLNQDLALYLDDTEVDRLRIGCELKGSATTDIQISGSGAGISQADALNDALKNMKKLQTVLITGSLPIKLNVVKMDAISPTLGKEFLRNVAVIIIAALVAVVGVIFVRYRKIKIILPIALTLVSEIILILGFAALVKWNLDLAAIAGIILTIGTGVDHLVIITDETLKGEHNNSSDWKRKIKNAMFIVMGAYLTVFASLLPLFWAGAGLLKGFALTTLAGLSFGVFIARPAYAAVVRILLEE